MKAKHFKSSDLSPTFTVMMIFLLCGAVLGSFSGSYAPKLELSNALLETSNNSYLYALFDFIKYNIFLLLFSKFFGFLIPFFVGFRGFCLFFSISAIYSSAETFFDNAIIFESVLLNLVHIPCFLLIATNAFKLFTEKAKTRRPKSSRLDERYIQIILYLFINFLWCSILFLVF